jgi:hypothetical protein
VIPSKTDFVHKLTHGRFPLLVVHRKISGKKILEKYPYLKNYGFMNDFERLLPLQHWHTLDRHSTFGEKAIGNISIGKATIQRPTNAKAMARFIDFEGNQWVFGIEFAPELKEFAFSYATLFL